MNAKRLEVFFEFLGFGIIIGIVEDLLAIKLATSEPITMKVIVIVVLVAIPFALLGEFVVDQIDFTRLIRGWLGVKSSRRRR